MLLGIYKNFQCQIFCEQLSCQVMVMFIVVSFLKCYCSWKNYNHISSNDDDVWCGTYIIVLCQGSLVCLLQLIFSFFFLPFFHGS
jgi:hypothetical protein